MNKTRDFSPKLDFLERVSERKMVEPVRGKIISKDAVGLQKFKLISF